VKERRGGQFPTERGQLCKKKKRFFHLCYALYIFLHIKKEPFKEECYFFFEKLLFYMKVSFLCALVFCLTKAGTLLEKEKGPCSSNKMSLF